MRIHQTVIAVFLLALPVKGFSQSYTGNAKAQAMTVTYNLAVGSITFSSGGSINVNSQNTLVNPTTFTSSVTVMGGILASSITLTSGGTINVNGQNSFQNPTTFTSSVTVNNNIVSNSSITASGLFGNGNGLTGFVVSASSSSTDTKAINNTAFVQATTMTVTLRGGRPLMGYATVHLINGTGGTRTYTIETEKGGVAISNQYVAAVTSAVSDGVIALQWFESSSSAGSQTYTISIKSDSTTATQSTTGRIISVVEF